MDDKHWSEAMGHSAGLGRGLIGGGGAMLALVCA